MASQRPHRSGKSKKAQRRPGTTRSGGHGRASRSSANRAANRDAGPGREPDLLAEIARTMATGRPLDVLADASSLIAAVDPGRKNPFDTSGSDDAPSTSLEELAQTFAEVDTPETSALLACIGQMASDELVRARARRALARRQPSLPYWLERLADTRAYRAVEVADVLGDGDDLLIGLRLPAGYEITLTVYIDHNVGTLVKDAFAVPGGVAEVVSAMRIRSDTRDVAFREISLADVRARAREAIDVAAMTIPPYESETWPACRPLVEWALRLMPEGGSGYQRPDWPEEQKDELADSFFASSFGATLDELDNRDLLDSILWFGTDYGPGDPMRWSNVAVEIVLLDWIPRKLTPNVKLLAKAPDLLRAFIRYCHDARGIRPGLTAQTLEAIDLYEPEYQRTIRSPRLQGPTALLAAVGALDDEETEALLPHGGDDYSAEFAYGEEYMLDRLAAAVGGAAVLDALDDAPLPDEEFGWADIAEDVRAVVSDVLHACDACCDGVLDAEYRTACRRLLARIAAGDPAVFRRKASPVISAAAICWLIGKANDLFGLYGQGMMVKDLMAHFGLASSSVSQRATAFLKAAGFNHEHYGNVRFGTPDLLVSTRRRHIIESRDRYRSQLAAD